MAKLFDLQALLALLASVSRTVARGVSAANAAQTVTQAAPGVGVALHVAALTVETSGAGEVSVTLNYERSGSQVFTAKTSGGILRLFDLHIATDENTAVSIDVPPVGVGETSTAQLITYEEDTP